MNLKHKFLYTLLGAGIMLVGTIIGTIVSPLTAQDSPGLDAEFRNITCERLVVTHPDGPEKAHVSIGADPLSGAMTIIGAYESYGRFSIFVGEPTSLTLYDSEFRQAVNLTAASKAGLLSIFAEGNTIASLAAHQDDKNRLGGGRIVLLDSYGIKRIAMGVDPDLFSYFVLMKEKDAVAVGMSSEDGVADYINKGMPPSKNVR